jgi:osomolarity two-component system response regulator SSK1
MQALIDFDGWRKWKDFSQQNADEKEMSKKSVLGGGVIGSSSAGGGGKKKKNRTSLGSRTTIKEEVEVGG